MRKRPTSRYLGLSVLVLATLALAHQLIYVVAHGAGDGYREAMSAAGHDGYWASFALAVGVVSCVLLAVAITQLRRLARLAHAASVGTLTVRDESPRALLKIVAPLWARVAVWTTIAFLIQENVEVATVGHAMPGLGAITGEHGLAIPIIAGVALVVALVRGLVRWRRDVLLARLRGARRPRAAVGIVLRPVFETRPVTGIDGARRNGVRAPPPRVPLLA